MKTYFACFSTITLMILFLGLNSFEEPDELTSSFPPLHKKSPAPGYFQSNNPDPITRTIDITKHFRPFPDLVAFRNTSLQKAPPPVLAEISEMVYGQPEVTRCWLNLDEMWDYRDRQFDYNFQIGVDKYRDISEKHRESWNWEQESPIHFHDYLKAFNDHSNAVMLTIRRYERDILDGNLPVSMEDWKMIFKQGLKHYKMLCPNLRYVEVCNEYSLRGFIGATDEEYYGFYKLACEAVYEVNEELGLIGARRVLVVVPNTVNSFIERLDHFFELYSIDQSPMKRLDFVSWHEYNRPMINTVHRENQIRNLLIKHGLPGNLPLFITEHDPYHPREDNMESHFANAAGLVKTLYFSSLYSPGLRIMPWVQYHNSEIQTRFIWFDGPNKPDTKVDEIHMLPIGASMKFLSMLKQGREVLVDNSVDREDIVLASVLNDRIIVEAVNYDTLREVSIKVCNLGQIFPGAEQGSLQVKKYLIDSNHSNCLADPEYPGGIQEIEDSVIHASDGQLILKHDRLEKNGLVLWEVIIGSTVNLDTL